MEGVQDHKYTTCLYHKEQPKFMNIGKDHEEDINNVNSDNESTTSSLSFEESDISNESSSSSDLLDDANAPLYGLSGLMEQLPIKRGLSKYYQGKSQSFTSLDRVTSLEDLAKKENPYLKRLKAWRSYGGGLKFKSFNQPKPTISKRVTKGFFV